MLNDWLSGGLSAEVRIWSALAPAVIVSGYFLLGFLVYVVRTTLVGQWVDAELSKRDSTVLTGKWIRMYFVWLMRPWWALLVRTGIPPTAVTTLSVLLATGSGVGLALGHFALGGWLYIFGGILDYMDGRLARQQGTASKGGSALDSILDRYSDAAVFTGLAWYYRDSWVLLAVLAALAGSSFVPYIRAKGEIWGVQMAVGVMQRAERIVYLGAAVALSPIIEALWDPRNPRPSHRLAIVSIVLMAVSTQLTSLHRLFHLLAALDGKDFSSTWLGSDRGALARRLTTSLVATGADFAAYATLVAVDLASPVLAAGMACLFGAMAHGSMLQLWRLMNAAVVLPRPKRFAFVAATSALLNAGGLAMMLWWPTIDNRVAWAIVHLAVFATWNFPLEREYLFAKRAETQAAA